MVKFRLCTLGVNLGRNTKKWRCILSMRKTQWEYWRKTISLSWEERHLRYKHLPSKPAFCYFCSFSLVIKRSCPRSSRLYKSLSPRSSSRTTIFVLMKKFSDSGSIWHWNHMQACEVCWIGSWNVSHLWSTNRHLRSFHVP